MLLLDNPLSTTQFLDHRDSPQPITTPSGPRLDSCQLNLAAKLQIEVDITISDPSVAILSRI